MRMYLSLTFNSWHFTECFCVPGSPWPSEVLTHRGTSHQWNSFSGLDSVPESLAPEHKLWNILCIHLIYINIQIIEVEWAFLSITKCGLEMWFVRHNQDFWHNSLSSSMLSSARCTYALIPYHSTALTDPSSVPGNFFGANSNGQFSTLLSWFFSNIWYHWHLPSFLLSSSQ